MSRKPHYTKPRLNQIFKLAHGEEEIGGLKLVDVERIKVQKNPRKKYNEQALAGLRESIHELKERRLGVHGTGVLQPLTVRKDDSAPPGEAGYLLIAGSRRLRALQELKHAQAPVIVVESNEDATRVEQLVENLQREALAPLEEAEAFRQLKDERRFSLRDLARMMGKDKGYIENRLGLLKAKPDVQEMVSLRSDTVSMAKQVDKVEDPTLRSTLIKEAVEGASYKEIAEKVKQATQPPAETITEPDEPSEEEETPPPSTYTYSAPGAQETTIAVPPHERARRQREALEAAIAQIDKAIELFDGGETKTEDEEGLRHTSAILQRRHDEYKRRIGVQGKPQLVQDVAAA